MDHSVLLEVSQSFLQSRFRLVMVRSQYEALSGDLNDAMRGYSQLTLRSVATELIAWRLHLFPISSIGNMDII